MDDDIKNRIVRNGIPYGKETIDDPTGKRGLLFACYQSDIEQGFQLIQKQWANTVSFPPDVGVQPGFDPIIGQVPKSAAQLQTNLFNANVSIAKFVTMRGGQYFFVPSISALKDTLGSPS